MPLNDTAVVTASQGFMFIAQPGTAAPTPDELEAADPEHFGCLAVNVKVTGTPTSYTLSIGGTETSAIPTSSGPAVVQAAIEAVEAVGVGNVLVAGVSAEDTAGLTITFIEALQGQSVAVTEGTYVGGTTPDTTVTTVTPLNGWKNIGHTSRDDMPEWGFDGGDTSVKGSWQRKNLREVADGDPIADFITINLEQWDTESLELYYGENAASTPGIFGVEGDFVPVEKAVLIIIVDGSVKIGFYAAKASIKRDDSINTPVDEFSSFPVKATFLKMAGRRLYDWINKALFS